MDFPGVSPALRAYLQLLYMWIELQRPAELDGELDRLWHALSAEDVDALDSHMYTQSRGLA